MTSTICPCLLPSFQHDANDNITVVCQHQMVVAWIRLKLIKLQETKANSQLTHKNSKLFLFKNQNDINDNKNINNSDNK